MASQPDIVEVIVYNNPHTIEIIGGYQGPPGPDPWLDPVQDLTADSGTIAIDYELGKTVRLTLEASPSLTVTNWPEDDRIARLTLEIHNAGAYAINWPASVVWPDGIEPTLTPNGTDVIVLTTTTGGNVVHGFPAGINFGTGGVDPGNGGGGGGGDGTARTVNHISAAFYTLQTSDLNALISFSSNDDVTVTLPPDLDVGFHCTLYRKGEGNIVLTTPHGSGYIQNADNHNALGGIKRTADLIVESNEGGSAASYLLTGSTSARDLPDPSRILDFLIDTEEAISVAFMQEDVQPGSITSWTSRGFRSKTATTPSGVGAMTRIANYGGVSYAKGATQYLSWPVDVHAHLLNRWGLVIARSDLANNPNQSDIQVGAIHNINSGAGRQPFIHFTSSEGNRFNAQLVDTTFRTAGQTCSQDYSSWNVLVWCRRGNYLHAWVNGVPATPVEIGASLANNVSSISWLGTNVAGKADTAIDCFILGQGYISDDFAKKVSAAGMWRVGLQENLPVDHPHRLTPPTFSDDDMWDRYEHDQADWDAFSLGSNGNSASAPSTDPTRYANRGQAEPAHTGYVPIFFDDFLENTLVGAQHDPSVGRARNWYAPFEINPGANVNVNALNATLTDGHGCYVHDGSGTGSVKLILKYSGGAWRSGSFASTDRMGEGRWLKCPFIREMKFRFNVPSVVGGFFPAFWGYSNHWLWRTRSLTEFDDWEADGLDSSWLNVTAHVHDPVAPGTFVKDDGTIYYGDLAEKIAGYPLNATFQYPATMDWYDGEWHVITSKVEEDFSYMYVDGYEVVRYPTPKALKEPINTIIDFAYRASSGAANTAESYEMEIDYVKFMKPASSLAVVPAEFTARPTLSGTFAVGQTITCVPNITASQIDYRWYRSDGTAIIGHTASTYVLTSAEAGLGIMANVKAWSLKDAPEAWTATSANVTA
jgi:hypothetical protein